MYSSPLASTVSRKSCEGLGGSPPDSPVGTGGADRAPVCLNSAPVVVHGGMGGSLDRAQVCSILLVEPNADWSNCSTSQKPLDDCADVNTQRELALSAGFRPVVIYPLGHYSIPSSPSYIVGRNLCHRMTGSTAAEPVHSCASRVQPARNAPVSAQGSARAGPVSPHTLQPSADTASLRASHSAADAHTGSITALRSGLASISEPNVGVLHAGDIIGAGEPAGSGASAARGATARGSTAGDGRRRFDIALRTATTEGQRHPSWWQSGNGARDNGSGGGNSCIVTRLGPFHTVAAAAVPVIETCHTSGELFCSWAANGRHGARNRRLPKQQRLTCCQQLQQCPGQQETPHSSF